MSSDFCVILYIVGLHSVLDYSSRLQRTDLRTGRQRWWSWNAINGKYGNEAKLVYVMRWLFIPAGRWFGVCKSECDWHEHGLLSLVDSSWNVMAHGDAREGKWRGNWRMEWVASRLRLKCDGTRWRTGGEVKRKLAEWVASTVHTTSEHGVSSITTADAHTSAASSRLNWRPRHFKWTRPFRWKTKSGFCACAITFQTQSVTVRVCTLIANLLPLISSSWENRSKKKFNI